MKVAFLLFAIGLSGCSTFGLGSSNPEELVKRRAGYDFNCEADQISIQQIDQEDSYGAKGCGMSGIYSVQCSLGPCQAQQVSKK